MERGDYRAESLTSLLMILQAKKMAGFLSDLYNRDCGLLE